MKEQTAPDYGYLQHGKAPGPFLTERVRLRWTAPDKWEAWYNGRWRVVHKQGGQLYIVSLGERITIQIVRV